MTEGRIFKSTSTGGCVICANYPEMAHRCFFEGERRWMMEAGIDPNRHNWWRGKIYNWYLAAEAAKKDPDIRRIVREEIYERNVTQQKFAALVQDGYDRLQKTLRVIPAQKMNPRDKRLYRGA